MRTKSGRSSQAYHVQPVGKREISTNMTQSVISTYILFDMTVSLMALICYDEKKNCSRYLMQDKSRCVTLSIWEEWSACLKGWKKNRELKEIREHYSVTLKKKSSGGDKRGVWRQPYTASMLACHFRKRLRPINVCAHGTAAHFKHLVIKGHSCVMVNMAD